MFFLYYSLGVFFIKKFNLATIGRESDEELAAVKLATVSADSQEMQYINALGGAANLINVDACTTRLRLQVKDSSVLNRPVLKSLGAKGFVIPSAETAQVILGPQAEIVASKIREALNSLGRESKLNPAVVKTTPAVVASLNPKTKADVDGAQSILAALGGANNVISANVVALTRVKIELKDDKLIDVAKIKSAGVKEIVNLSNQTKQLYLGNKAEAIASGINQLLK